MFSKNKLKEIALLITAVLTTGLATEVYAKSVIAVNAGEESVNPLSNMTISSATQRSQLSNYTINFRASCFGANLRSVSNPIDPNLQVKMSGNLDIDAIKYTFSFSFPGNVATNTGTTLANLATPDIKTLSGAQFAGTKSLSTTGNLLLMGVAGNNVASIDPVTAKISGAQARFVVSSIIFEQNGKILSVGSMYMNQSSDGKNYDIEASFPGAAGYCGGYYSPLMVFMDGQRPQFNNIVDFDMGTGLKTYWPEKNHRGYILALPVKNKVLTVNELFGEGPKYVNGFEKLSSYDLNKDGKIDAQDPVFKKLVLWKDKSGMGFYNRKDALKLSQVVRAINLKYSTANEQISAGAEFRERSTIKLTDKYRKYQKQAYIVDVWFKPVFDNKLQKTELSKLSSL